MSLIISANIEQDGTPHHQNQKHSLIDVAVLSSDESDSDTSILQPKKKSGKPLVTGSFNLTEICKSVLRAYEFFDFAICDLICDLSRFTTTLKYFLSSNM